LYYVFPVALFLYNISLNPHNHSLIDDRPTVLAPLVTATRMVTGTRTGETLPEKEPLPRRVQSGRSKYADYE
jgi:hypothetical protein